MSVAAACLDKRIIARALIYLSSGNALVNARYGGGMSLLSQRVANSDIALIMYVAARCAVTLCYNNINNSPYDRDVKKMITEYVWLVIGNEHVVCASVYGQ